MKSLKIISTYLLLAAFSMHVAHAAQKAGNVKVIKGDVTATLENETRNLSKGDAIFSNDKITTEKGAIIELAFVDDSKFLLGPDSQMSIDKFNYKKNSTSNSFSSRLLKGSFRFVTGLIARYRPDSMAVNTPVATIGIRGTTVAVEATETSATIILDKEEDSNKKTAIEVSNEFGSVFIDEQGYGTEIPDAQSPPSPPRRMRLQTVNNLMRSLQSVQRVNIPRPRM